MPCPPAASNKPPVLGRSYSNLGFFGAPLYEYATLSSTNTFLLHYASYFPPGTAILAHSQTKGRGTRAKRWYDAPGGCLLISYLLPALMPLKKNFNLAQVGALALLDTLQRFLLEQQKPTLKIAPNAALKVKWPNDVLGLKTAAAIPLWGKLAGFLVEAAPGHQFVLGMGVNLNLNENAVAQLDRGLQKSAFPPISLRQLTQPPLSPLELVRRFRPVFLTDWKRLQQNDFSAFQARWKKHSLLIGSTVRFRLAPLALPEAAKVLSLTPQGALLVYNVKKKKKQVLVAGEVWLDPLS